MILAIIVFLLVVDGRHPGLECSCSSRSLLGVANAVDMPVRQSFGIEMVGREDLTNAVALDSAMFNGARVIGPGHRRPRQSRTGGHRAGVLCSTPLASSRSSSPCC